MNRTLEQELADLEAVRALVVDRILDVPTCTFPKSHATKAAPHFDEHGELRCWVCKQ